MDGNKDEALRCRRLADNYLKDGNKERAFKFLHKAQKLYPSKEVEDLIESLSKNGMSTGAKHETRDENLRHRTANGSATHSAPEEKNYTPEQAEAVKKCRVFMQRRHNHGRRHRPQQFHEEEENEPPLLHSLLQFMPILLLVGLSLMSSFMLQDPPYSLSRTGSYYIQRETPKRKIPFYVQEGFEDQYENKIHMIEKRVEDDYIGRLQSQCYRERQYREEVRARARFWRDQALLNRANAMPMKSCEALEKIAA
ncbi:dnaJ homolog subfamily B member 1-like [Pocillopora damicornis]|uniref:dnaJ homolog subfamily B member 1-like n=1 Tax=Pocillopora damicornis TaxID=46731 RepID=UPI000F54DE63|nr:dnaJ homolog subfamily B member 1-like [Pocillopora damicornis]